MGKHELVLNFDWSLCMHVKWAVSGREKSDIIDSRFHLAELAALRRAARYLSTAGVTYALCAVSDAQQSLASILPRLGPPAPTFYSREPPSTLYSSNHFPPLLFSPLLNIPHASPPPLIRHFPFTSLVRDRRPPSPPNQLIELTFG